MYYKQFLPLNQWIHVCLSVTANGEARAQVSIPRLRHRTYPAFLFLIFVSLSLSLSLFDAMVPLSVPVCEARLSRCLSVSLCRSSPQYISPPCRCPLTPHPNLAPHHQVPRWKALQVHRIRRWLLMQPCKRDHSRGQCTVLGVCMGCVWGLGVQLPCHWDARCCLGFELGVPCVTSSV
jgi:hypothetical protein